MTHIDQANVEWRNVISDAMSMYPSRSCRVQPSETNIGKATVNIGKVNVNIGKASVTYTGKATVECGHVMRCHVDAPLPLL